MRSEPCSLGSTVHQADRDAMDAEDLIPAARGAHIDLDRAVDGRDATGIAAAASQAAVAYRRLARGLQNAAQSAAEAAGVCDAYAAVAPERSA